MSHVIPEMTGKLSINVGTNLFEFKRIRELSDRRLYLYGTIEPIENDNRALYFDASVASRLVESILDFNRYDEGIPSDERDPIRLYINSPGGSITEGLALVAAIEISKTPIYTINLGEWSSMAFLIGICGHKRFSLKNATFLMHDGATATYGSANKVQDRIDFEKRIEREVIKPHVLKYSKMTSASYDAFSRVELYMLPEDALEHGFIDVIVENIDEIL